MATRSRDADEPVASEGPSRRGFLYGGAAVGLGAAAGAVAERHGLIPGFAVPERPDTAGLNGASTVAFHGAHQAGVETPPPAFVTYLAFDLRDDAQRPSLARMMRLLSDDARRLMSGEPALADLEPEIVARPANLAITFGFGPELFAARTRRACRRGSARFRRSRSIASTSDGAAATSSSRSAATTP